MKNGKKRVKWKMFFASPYEIEALEKLLENEAASGWMFIKCLGLFYVFEECEPIKLKYQIDYFDKATIFDTNPKSKTLDYIEYCRESSWHHIFSSGKMQIFYSVDENPIPIQTDENMKFQLASKATLLASWTSWIFLPLIGGFTLVHKVITNLWNPINYISYSSSITDSMEMGLEIFWSLYTLFAIINIIRFGMFYFINKRRLKRGLNIKYYSFKNVQRFSCFYLIFLLLIMVYLVAISTQSTLYIRWFLVVFISMLFMILLVNKISYSKWANRQINIALTVVLPIVVTVAVMCGIFFSIIFGNNLTSVSFGNTKYSYLTDDIDITLYDLGIDKPDKTLYEETIHDKSEWFLGKREEYSDYFFDGDNSYGYTMEIFSSKYSSIIDKYNKLVLKYQDYSFTELAATENTWMSNQVFYGVSGNNTMYVVIEEGITFVITGDLNKVQAAKLSFYSMKSKRNRE